MDLNLTRESVTIILFVLLVVGLLMHIRDVRRFKAQKDIRKATTGIDLIIYYSVPYLTTSGFAIYTLFNIFHTDLLRGLTGGYVALLSYIFFNVSILKTSPAGTERYKRRYETVYWAHIFGIVLVLVGIINFVYQLNFL